MKYDNASLVQIPSGYKASTLYSVLPQNGDGDFDFTRGSSATRVNENGLIESVGSNVPRLNYELLNGSVQSCPALLLEPSRKNDFVESEDYSTLWTKNEVTLTSNSIISPDGSVNASTITENGTANPHFIFQIIGTTSLAQYAVSIFAKANGRMLQIFAGFGDISGNAYANFDLNNGVLSNNGCDDASIEYYGNGWYRCSVVVTVAVTTGFNPCFGVVESLSSSRASGYTGDGTSGIYLWGAMVEQGSYATSYIPTSGSTVTRAAETCNGAGTSADFNDSEGVLFAEISALVSGSETRVLSISNGNGASISNVYLNLRPSANEIGGQVIVGGVTQCDLLSTSTNQLNSNKLALKYKENDFAFWINGFEVDTDSVGSTFTDGTLDRLNLDFGQGSFDFYGKSKQVATFNVALSDSQLEDLTSWDSFAEMATSQLYTIE